MKHLMLVFIFIIMKNVFSQLNTSAYMPQFEFDTILQSTKKNTFMISNESWISKYVNNVDVARNPEEVLITKDDQFAFVRCFLSNTVELINIPTGEIVKSFSIPSPKDIVLSNDGNKVLVASIVDKPFPPNPPTDDCSPILISLSGHCFLTTIDVESQEIVKIDTIKTLSIRRILKTKNDSIIYLQGNEILEYNLLNSTIVKNWEFPEQIFNSKIDNKNNKIFLTTIDSIGKTLFQTINLLTDTIIISQYYMNNEYAWATHIGLDTVSNRIFVQGKVQAISEVLVFDAISLNQLPPIVNAFMNRNSFITIPEYGSLFIGAGYPNNTVELDYLTLEEKQILPFPSQTQYHTFQLNKNKTSLFTFQYGSSEGGGSIINPPQYLDIIEYNIETGNYEKHNITEHKYGCSYGRSMATTDDGQYILITNSPDNTISIIKIPHNNTNKITSSNIISIFPNPTSDILHIKFENLVIKKISIEIYNCMGTLTYKTLVVNFKKEQTLDISNLSKGIYICKISTGNKIITKKLVKE